MGREPWSIGYGRRLISKGRGFESRHHILDGDLFTLQILQQINDVCLKRPKKNDKRGRGWLIF